MSYTEKINQMVLDFFSKSSETILQIRDFKLIKKNNNIKTKNSQKSSDENIDISITKISNMEDSFIKNSFNIINESKYKVVEKIIDKNAKWLLPDDKEIFIELYTQKNGKPVKIEQWHMQFFHKKPKETEKNEENIDNNNINMEDNNTSIYNQNLIRDPNKFNQCLSILLRSIIQMLYTLPLHNFLSNQNQFIQKYQQESQQYQSENKEKLDQSKKFMKLQKKIHIDQRSLGQFCNKEEYTKKSIKYHYSLLNHEFIFTVIYLEDLILEEQFYLPNKGNLIYQNSLLNKNNNLLHNQFQQQEQVKQKQQNINKQQENLQQNLMPIYENENEKQQQQNQDSNSNLEEVQNRYRIKQEQQTQYQKEKRKIRKTSEQILDKPQFRKKSITLQVTSNQSPPKKYKKGDLSPIKINTINSNNSSQKSNQLSSNSKKQENSLKNQSNSNNSQYNSQNSKENQKQQQFQQQLPNLLKQNKWELFEQTINLMKNRLEEIGDPFPRKICDVQKILQQSQTQQQQIKLK